MLTETANYVGSTPKSNPHDGYIGTIVDHPGISYDEHTDNIITYSIIMRNNLRVSSPYHPSIAISQMT